jgi:formamidopyrimidine-DNA glycosylase
MPELPEVEVTKQGIEPYIQGQKVTDVKIYDGRLRWPVPKNLGKILLGQKVHQIKRRGKYLLFRMDDGHLIVQGSTEKTRSSRNHFWEKNIAPT